MTKVLSKNSRKHLRKSCYMLLGFGWGFFGVFFFFFFLQKMKASVGCQYLWLLYISSLSIADLKWYILP